jgi:hypothetical protein
MGSGISRGRQVGLSPITEALSPTTQQSRSSQIPFRALPPSRISAAEPHHRQNSDYAATHGITFWKFFSRSRKGAGEGISNR